MKEYNLNVFINCPFDDSYLPLFNAMLFAIHRCGFVPRCSKEFDDTSTIRLQNIMKIIEDSKYAIHDLSRVSLDSHNNLPRFNMPLELGLFIGCKNFGNKNHKEKEYIIIESEQHRFKQFISDISGSDIRAHNDDPKTLVMQIRNWLANRTSSTIPSPTIIYDDFVEFNKNLPMLCKSLKWIEEELTYKEYLTLVVTWLALDS